MTTRRTSVVVGLPLIVALFGIGCAKATDGTSGTSGASGSGGIEHPKGSNDLVLRAEIGGASLPMEYRLAEVPVFSLYGDGRVVATGPQIAIYPAPALPSLAVRRIGEDGVQAILRAAREAGLRGPDRRVGRSDLAGTTTTTFTVVAEGDVHVTSVHALGENQLAVPSDQLEMRRVLSAFGERLTDLDRWLPQGSVGAEVPFELSALRVFVMPGFPEGPQDLRPAPKDWPLSEPLASFGQPVADHPDVRCAVVSGQDLQELRPLLEQDANQLTPWRSGDDEYHLVIRPLLPDESGC